MQAFFQFLQQYPYLLLFFVVGLAVYIGRASIKGYGLGMVAGAIVVGAGISVWASSYGVKLELNNFAKSLFYYLFMYGVGLRVGPSFVNSLRGDGIKFLFLAVVSSVIGLTLVVLGAKLFALPPGAAGGMLAGSQTMSAAIGSAEQAVTSGVVKLPAGMKPEDASGMIALSYGITYIWGTVGIILICKYLPRWWGVDAKAAAKKYEQEFGVKDLEGGALTGYRQFGLRAYRLENPATIGMSIAKFRTVNPEYRIVNVGRNGEPQGADPELVLQKGDIVALGGSTEHLTEKMGLIGPEVADAKTLGIPMDQAEIVVFNKDVVGRTFESFRDTAIAGQLQVTKVERGGVQIPAGLKTKLERMDIVSVVGLKSAVNELGEMWGRIARANTSTDLLTLSVGMIIGFLIGMIEFPAFGAKVGLGNAGGLLLSGVIVSSVVSRLRFFGNTPNAARNVLEDLGLVVFVAIVGVNAGAGLLAQLTGAVALKIFIVGFIACTIPPFIVWAIGYHVFKINPAVLMGGVAGARSHSGPCREAAVEIQSSVPWIGFPVGYAVSGILLTIFGYFAMILAQ
ncbi:MULTISPECIES: aspartate:alanine exchanger family transporter [Bradyrhizobium]|uniref:aspartate:alanine exchanger family transporter n=1 Tax=Bradyrhizobium TaxID=374 RepID=UPI000D640FF7|nr:MULTISPECIES: transporter [unclassified Bradyrhizobium]MCA1372099.1 transporter [Bradyrhizobium sp. IC4060]MCA1388608.1 transporter [Bradyrhizobium sp. IC3123]MCA1433012.1 transporter [Bradyrhizobium sp. BRP20]MCA1474692.1 transporter [Bradyrhizobium sp. NBAIM08]MCA1486969.1 transporter [Bradyrhizobium sp. IC4061]